MSRRALQSPPLAPTTPPTPTAAQRAADLKGRICSFYPAPGCVVGCVPVKGATRYAGTITAASPAPPVQPGNVPDFTVTIQGRTGKTATVSVTLNYVTLHPSWDAALSSP